MRTFLRHIAGFTFGLTMFGIVIPNGLIELAAWDHSITHLSLIDSETLRIIISLPVFLIGISFAIWSNVFLVRIGEGGPAEAFNIAISPKTKKLVTTGPYRYSRNPMMFGAFSVYTAIGIFLNSLFCLIAILIFLFPATIFLKRSEEKRLLRDFGDEYREYRKRVSMYFPVKRKRDHNKSDSHNVLLRK